MKLVQLFENVDRYYHATYKPYLDSILRHGLDSSKGKKNWEDSKGVVYLSTDPDVAESYAETSDIVPEEYLDQIIVLTIDGNKLSSDLLHVDRNVRNGDGHTVEYHGIVPADAISV